MSILSGYDEYNIAVYTADGGQASKEDCYAVKEWMDETFVGRTDYDDCNIGMTGRWPSMWRDMAALTAAFPHLMFEVYFVPYHDDRRQWYFHNGMVDEAEEITKWTDYDPAELRPMFSGGERD